VELLYECSPSIISELSRETNFVTFVSLKVSSFTPVALTKSAWDWLRTAVTIEPTKRQLRGHAA
jgi:hypothetical protein